MKRRTYLSIGSNLGDRQSHLREAVRILPGVTRVSDVYETEPVGGPTQGPFLNVIVELDWEGSPSELLGLCHRIESAAGRTRGERWAARTLDLDIVWMEGVELESDVLTIPHPRWKQRRFVLAPLRELAPDLVSATDVELADGHVAKLGALTT